MASEEAASPESSLPPLSVLNAIQASRLLSLAAPIAMTLLWYSSAIISRASVLAPQKLASVHLRTARAVVHPSMDTDTTPLHGQWQARMIATPRERLEPKWLRNELYVYVHVYAASFHACYKKRMRDLNILLVYVAT